MIGEAMTETYDEHMAEMLRLGGAHECASDCPLPLPRRDPRADQIPTAEQPHARHIEWGINVVDCQERALSSIPDTGTARQKHAAWCWLPLDHQGQCEGDQ